MSRVYLGSKKWRWGRMLEFETSDWAFNSALSGFINIVGVESVAYTDSNRVSLNEDALKDFTGKYFDYLIDTYEKVLPWYRIVSYKRKIVEFEENQFDNFSEKDLENLNLYMRNVVKHYFSSASYKAVFSLIDADFDPEVELKALKPINLKKEDIFSEVKADILPQVRENFVILRKLIDYGASEKGRKYLAGKNVVFSVIKNNWEGVSFLNRNTKEKDFYIDFENHFVEPAKAYLKADKSKYKYHCAICNSKIKDLKLDYSFLTNTGFDVYRKPSHIWNENNDLAMCPVCRLVYTCMPAGFTFIQREGIFINIGKDIKEMVRTNKVMKNDLNMRLEARNKSVYRALVSLAQEKKYEKHRYELVNIQVVYYEDGVYRFNLLSKRALELMNRFEKELHSLIGMHFKEGNVRVYLFKEVVKNLQDNQNLFLLIHKLVYYKVANYGQLHYYPQHIMNMLKINSYFTEGVGKMSQKIMPEELEKVRAGAYYFKEELKSRKREQKLPGMAHQLLNAVKTVDRGLFMDIMLRGYSELDKQIPKIFLRIFESDENFKIIGYAYLIGLVGDNKENNKEEENEN
ncbi:MULTISPECIES: type I-B CRISPR-associated protein Cas8b1/Cst1 [Listeria]|uniref:type I-B CRISPR-associated protein Cas8b1/Cst1 n=1 Tax=Listeria TaxID=1637 RepID=UPI000B58DDCC|nr:MULTISPECIES: type I-B CRISPR-associated protein Cas8b1/Cst1 [Listeria]